MSPFVPLATFSARGLTCLRSSTRALASRSLAMAPPRATSPPSAVFSTRHTFYWRSIRRLRSPSSPLPALPQLPRRPPASTSSIRCVSRRHATNSLNSLIIFRSQRQPRHPNPCFQHRASARQARVTRRPRASTLQLLNHTVARRTVHPSLSPPLCLLRSGVCHRPSCNRLHTLTATWTAWARAPSRPPTRPPSRWQ